MKDNYMVVTATAIDRLVKLVNQFIKQGWITQGGITYSAKEKKYLQAMITTTSLDNEDEYDNEESIVEDNEAEQIDVLEPVDTSNLIEIGNNFIEDFPIEKLDLSIRAFRALKSHHIHTVKELLAFDLNKINDKAAIKEIQTAIEKLS